MLGGGFGRFLAYGYRLDKLRASAYNIATTLAMAGERCSSRVVSVATGYLRTRAGMHASTEIRTGAKRCSNAGPDLKTPAVKLRSH